MNKLKFYKCLGCNDNIHNPCYCAMEEKYIPRKCVLLNFEKCNENWEEISKEEFIKMIDKEETDKNEN